MGTPLPPAANPHLSSALHSLAEWLTGQSKMDLMDLMDKMDRMDKRRWN